MDAMILLVDDEPGVLRLCQRLLERAGAQVIAVSSSSQALSVLTRQQFNLLLADIRMPSLSGFQLMDLARQQQPDISVVLMTGYGTIDIAIEALQRGADGLILKPFVGDELVRSVENALQEGLRKRDSQRLRVLRPLFDTFKQFFTETELENLQAQVLDAVCSHLACTNAAIFLRPEGETDITIVEQRGETLRKVSPGAFIDLIESAISNGQPVWVNSSPSSNGSASNLRDIVSRAGFESVVCVAVEQRDGMHILLAGRGAGEGVFREVDQEMLVLLARQAAAAGDNALLYAEVREHMQQLEKSQRALLQVEKMAAAGRLTASIAHEINNPLQSLSNCLYLVGRDDLQPLDRQKYLNAAQEELDRLMTTVQRMLDLYRPVARQRNWISVQQVVERVLILMEPQLKQSNIGVKTHFGESIPDVLAVSSQIQQVLLNLLLNAVEAMPDGGEIMITAKGFPDHVEVLVKDTGPGIPENELDRIFEPFVSTKEQGTGLGLSVSYGIIQAHGGALELVTGKGKGACFRIILPVGGTG